MTTLSQPQPRSRWLRPRLPIVIAIVLIVALIITLVVQNIFGQPATSLQSGAPAEVMRGSLVLGISATGQVEPRLQSELAFPAGSGRVKAVLVTEGDVVAAEAPLVELESRQTAAEVAAARAAVAVAQADLQALTEGATTEQIAAAQAEVAAAQASLVQIQGSVTATDLEAAQTAVEEARARLALLEAGPGNEEVTRAQTTLTGARADLERHRANLAAAKEQARRAAKEQANAVRDAQTAYSAAYWDLEHVKDNETDPRTGRPLNEIEQQDFANAFDTAARALANAEQALAQAVTTYEAAQQDERSGLDSAEAQVAAAEADLDALLAGSDADELAAARAQLARAQAEVARLTGAQRQGALDAQQANVAAAQSRLDQLLTDPKASDLARAEARLAQAQAQLEQAEIRLAETILQAPFAGTVAAVNVTPGEAVGQVPPIVLIDTERYLVKVTVDEVDVARVAVGQPVDVLIDALGEPLLAGEVQNIEPLPQSDQGVTAYRVTIEIMPDERTLKAGMTASATIIAERRDDTLYVPAQAVRVEDGQAFVDVVSADANGDPVVTPQPVETDLRVGEQIEIVSGLSEGQEVLTPAP